MVLLAALERGTHAVWASASFAVADDQQLLHVLCLQTPCQRYWKQLLKWVEEGKIHPDMVR